MVWWKGAKKLEIKVIDFTCPVCERTSVEVDMELRVRLHNNLLNNQECPGTGLRGGVRTVKTTELVRRRFKLSRMWIVPKKI